jgi:hypothetical protein
MPVNTSAQGNISISAINAENAATTSNNLSTLSTTAIEAGNVSTLNEAPYFMSEFGGYTHAQAFPQATSSNVEFASAAGLSLTSYQHRTHSIVPPNSAAPKAGYTVQVTVNAYGAYFYVKEYWSNASSTYNKSTSNTLSTTYVLMSYSPKTISDISHYKINFDATLTATNTGGGFMSNGSTGWLATSGTSTSSSASLYVQASAECHNTSIREATGDIEIYLRGPGYLDTLVAAHDFEAEAIATATACF